MAEAKTLKPNPPVYPCDLRIWYGWGITDYTTASANSFQEAMELAGMVWLESSEGRTPRRIEIIYNDIIQATLFIY